MPPRRQPAVEAPADTSVLAQLTAKKLELTNRFTIFQDEIDKQIEQLQIEIAILTGAKRRAHAVAQRQIAEINQELQKLGHSPTKQGNGNQHPSLPAEENDE